MSIQPNRVIARIIEQVDQSDWPPLEPTLLPVADGDGLMRVFEAPAHARYATPLHFWVHALREDLRATGHRDDLVATACHAICRDRSVVDWLDALEARVEATSGDVPEILDALRARVAEGGGDAQVHRMLDSDCRRSSVLADRAGFVADFQAHGPVASWRRGAGCPL